MSYRLAIFDFDGTLADSWPFFMSVFNEIADQHGFRRVDAARRAGIAFGAVGWGYASMEALRRVAPEREFGTPADLLSLASQTCPPRNCPDA